jgi:REP element-mobilizing transposase RayT
MARGIARQPIFRDDADRDDFARRLAGLAEAGALKVYAWALLPNHVHLLVRTATRPLSRSMRSLLTGYAGTFNRRHKRNGHLFQNRYKSIACEEESYFLELIRYLHLNPLRAGLVADLRGLDRYPYTGHAALVGAHSRPWQDTDLVLRQFASSLPQARKRYRAFVAEGIPLGRRPDLMGGGLVRSAGGWIAVQALRRGREGYAADERILGGTSFVEQLLREVESEAGRRLSPKLKEVDTKALIRKVCQAERLTPGVLLGGGRRKEICRAREGLAYLWVEYLGRSGRQIAQELGIRPESVYKAARRGRNEQERWKRLLAPQKGH